MSSDITVGELTALEECGRESGEGARMMSSHLGRSLPVIKGETDSDLLFVSDVANEQGPRQAWRLLGASTGKGGAEAQRFKVDIGVWGWLGSRDSRGASEVNLVFDGLFLAEGGAGEGEGGCGVGFGRMHRCRGMCVQVRGRV